MIMYVFEINSLSVSLNNNLAVSTWIIIFREGFMEGF